MEKWNHQISSMKRRAPAESAGSLALCSERNHQIAMWVDQGVASAGAVLSAPQSLHFIQHTNFTTSVPTHKNTQCHNQRENIRMYPLHAQKRAEVWKEKRVWESGRAVLAYSPSIAMMFWSGLNHGARLRRGGLDRSSAQGEETGTRIKWYILELKKKRKMSMLGSCCAP